MEFFRNLASLIVTQIASIRVFDVIDIIVVSIIFYYSFKFISDRRAGKLAVGIIFIIVALVLSDVFNMHSLNFLLENIVQVGIIGLLIVFQTELRTFLEKVGGSSIIGSLNKRNSGDMQKIMECIDGVVESCVSSVYGKQQIHRVVFCCEVFRARRGFNSHIMPSPTFPRF